MSSRARIGAAFLAIYLIWGSTYLAIRLAVATLPPFLMAGTRFLTAGLLLFAWLGIRGELRATWLEWRDATIVGGLMLLGGNGVVSWAEQFVPSGLAALIVSTIPIWVVLLDWLWMRQSRPDRRTIAGLALGFLGVAMLVRPHAAVGSGSVSLLGGGALLLAAALWAAGTLYSRKAARPKAPLLGAAMQMVTGGLLLLVTGTLTGEWSRLNLHGASTLSLLSLVYLILFGSLVGLTSYLWLIQVTTPARASTYAFVNPIVAIILGWAIAREELRPMTAVAAAVAISGVVLIVNGTRSRRATEDDAAPVSVHDAPRHP
jgi:drug/metabolite transporter (DMT)-like permease